MLLMSGKRIRAENFQGRCTGAARRKLYGMLRVLEFGNEHNTNKTMDTKAKELKKHVGLQTLKEEEAKEEECYGHGDGSWNEPDD